MEFYDILIPWLQRKNTRLRRATSVDAQVGAYLYYVTNVGRHRKTSQSFTRISFTNNWKISHVLTTFLGSQLVKLLKTEIEVKGLVNTFLEKHNFPQCIRAIDGTHIEIKEPNEYYIDYINRKTYYSINLQAVCG